MDKYNLELLYTIIFGLTFGWMGNQMLKDIFPLGIGDVFKSGFGGFIIKLLIVGFTFLFSSLGFLVSIKIIKSMNDQIFLIQLCDIVILLALACTPWLAYHITRIVFKPFTNLYNWNSLLNNVDVLFIFFYIVSLSLVILVRKLFVIIMR